MDRRDVEREARRLLQQILRPRYTPSGLRSEYVRCLVCDELVPMEEASICYDESGQFEGWECEIHI